MLDEFEKANKQKKKENSSAFEEVIEEVNEDNFVLPDSADSEILAEDGKPLTPQVKAIYEMREEIAEMKPKSDEIVMRKQDLPSDPSKTINSNLRDIPKLCDQCYLIDKCPHYEPGAQCYFRNEINIEGSNSLVELMKMMIEVQGERVLFGRLVEQSEGGYIDQNLSKEMKLLMELMKDFKEVVSPPKEQIKIEASRPVTGEGGGGILSQIFGGGDNQ